MAEADMDDGRFAPLNVLDGELVESTERALSMSNAFAPQEMDTSLVAVLTRAELDHKITTAKAYPRSAQRALDSSMELATLTKAAAESCGYSVPRGRDDNGKAKAITGKSVRLAEIVAARWGNCRVGARVTQINREEGYVEAEGVFHDLETNYEITSRVRRSIKGKPYQGKPGRLFSDDMINVTGNAAAAIAKRNAIFNGVPAAVSDAVYEATQKIVRGDLKTLAANRDEMLTAYSEKLGLQPAQVFAALGVPGVNDIGLDELVIARGFFSALRSNEITIEDLIKSASPSAPGQAAAASKGMAQANTPNTAPPPKEDEKPRVGRAAAPKPEGHKLERKAPAAKAEETPPPPHDPQTGEIDGAPGPAPRDTPYTLTTDDRSEHNTLPLYLNGLKIGDSGIHSGTKAYDAHPEGTVQPQAKPEGGAGDIDWQGDFDEWRTDITENTSDTAEIEHQLGEYLEGDPAPPETFRQLARQVALERVMELAPDADPGMDPWLFELWVETAAPAAVSGKHQTLMRTNGFKKLAEDARDRINAAAKAAMGRA